MNSLKIGKKIYELRKDKNMTQGDLAEQLQISRKLVSKWETGNIVPSSEFLFKLCDVFDVDMNTLLEEKMINRRTKVSKTVSFSANVNIVFNIDNLNIIGMSLFLDLLGNLTIKNDVSSAVLLAIMIMLIFKRSN